MNPRFAPKRPTSFTRRSRPMARAGRIISSLDYDAILQARTGIVSVTGPDQNTPIRAGVSILDMGAGCGWRSAS